MSRIYWREGAPPQGHGYASSAPRPDDDRALGDREIMSMLGISRPTLLRYRRDHGLPGPHFRVGQRSFTWRSAVSAWIAAREAAGVAFQPAMNRGRADAKDAAGGN